MAEYKQPKEVALPTPRDMPKRRGKIYGCINLAPNKLSGYPETDVKRDGVETRGTVQQLKALRLGGL